VVLKGWLEETKHVYITRILEMILTVFSFEKKKRFFEKLNGCVTPIFWKELKRSGEVGFEELSFG